YGDLSCYGQKTLRTPGLDLMAKEGLRFTRHYAGNTVCSPSRAVLMTGCHSGHLPIRGNSNGPLPDNMVTLPGLLKKAGYHTACIGKWGVGNEIPLDDPGRKGFDEFYGYVSMYHAHNFFPEFLIRNGQKEALPNRLFPEWREKGREGSGIAEVQKVFAPHHLQEEVLKYLGARADEKEPFFLYYALNIPHANNEGSHLPPRGMEVPLGKDGRPEYGEFATRDWPDPEKGFASYLNYIDGYVAAILEKLRETGQAEDTLVIFSSDNGPHKEGGHDHEFFDSNGPFSGFKRAMTDGGIRVPMIAWGPGLVKKGGKSAHLSGFQDILPTFCELAKIKVPLDSNWKCDGYSLVPVLTGQGKQKTHDFLYWEFHRNRGASEAAILEGDWKLIARLEKSKLGPPLRLYSTRDDPGEKNDLSKTESERAERMLEMARKARGEQ
ncbi:arylsulfatase, partial [Akkermansiaceae bacterium]|nr:arylsulfatase [Akkermansiaceae bacterium]